MVAEDEVAGVRFVPHELTSRVSPERLENISGIQVTASIQHTQIDATCTVDA